jgi:hypothetical protein
LIAQAKEILPFEFKVGFHNMFYWAPESAPFENPDSETVAVNIFFIRVPS